MAQLQKYTGNEEDNETTVQAMTERSEVIDFNTQTTWISLYEFTSETVKRSGECNAGYAFLCSDLSGGRVCLHTDVDGSILDLIPSPVDSTLEVGSSATDGSPAHVRTFPALGFIQASKRERRLMALTDDLDYACILEQKRYLYIYKFSRGTSGECRVVDTGMGL
jgi:hypothetical protein